MILDSRPPYSFKCGQRDHIQKHCETNVPTSELQGNKDDAKKESEEVAEESESEIGESEQEVQSEQQETHQDNSVVERSPTQREKRKSKNGTEGKIPEKIYKVETTGYVIKQEKRTSEAKRNYEDQKSDKERKTWIYNNKKRQSDWIFKEI